MSNKWLSRHSDEIEHLLLEYLLPIITVFGVMWLITGKWYGIFWYMYIVIYIFVGFTLFIILTVPIFLLLDWLFGFYDAPENYYDDRVIGTVEYSDHFKANIFRPQVSSSPPSKDYGGLVNLPWLSLIIMIPIGGFNIFFTFYIMTCHVVPFIEGLF